MIILTLFKGSTGSKENDVDGVLNRSQLIRELVDIKFIDLGLSLVVCVADLKECLFLVIDDTMADECDEIQVIETIIRCFAASFYII